MSEIHIETEKPEELAEGTERALGHVEAEVEHHGDDLKEHDGRIETLETLKEWTEQRISRMESMIAETSTIPTDVLEELRTEIRQLKETIEKPLTTENSLTELPKQVESESKSEEKPERKHLVDRIL